MEILKGGRLNGNNENWVSLQRNITGAQRMEQYLICVPRSSIHERNFEKNHKILVSCATSFSAILILVVAVLICLDFILNLLIEQHAYFICLLTNFFRFDSVYTTVLHD
jgi:hypothetical protein